MARDIRSRRRNVRMGFKRLQIGMATLPTVAPETLRDVLQAESNAPLRGGNRELGNDSLFGDGHRQLDMLDGHRN
jgi:hypothetical protein